MTKHELYLLDEVATGGASLRSRSPRGAAHPLTGAGDLLSQEEIDALLYGVNDDLPERRADEPVAPRRRPTLADGASRSNAHA